MALLSGMIRQVAITGRTDTIDAWFAGRQGGRWAEQTIRAAFPGMDAPRTPAPAPAAPVDPDATREALAALRERGVVTAAEYERLSTRLGV